jgi:hypothetical protein
MILLFFRYQEFRINEIFLKRYDLVPKKSRKCVTRKKKKKYK